MDMPHAPRILLIEDDVRLAENLRQVLEDEGFVVTCCTRGDDGFVAPPRAPSTWC